MSGKKRDKTAAREEEHRLRSEAMTGKKMLLDMDPKAVRTMSLYVRQQGRRSGGGIRGKKKSPGDHYAWMYSMIEGLVREDVPEFYTHWQVACIMRRAAGLPYTDTPASGWQENGTPEMFSIVHGVIFAASGPTWDHPESVSKELFKVRHSLRDLKRRLLSLDKQVFERLNQYADPIWRQEVFKLADEFADALTLEEFHRNNLKFIAKLDSLHHQTPIEATLEQMDRLEEGLTEILEEVEDDAHERADMGQLRTYAAKEVALGVAEYMYRVNGKIPGLWTGENPSGPYAKAILEIFDILDIPPGSLQRAGEYAIAKFKSGVES